MIHAAEPGPRARFHGVRIGDEIARDHPPRVTCSTLRNGAHRLTALMLDVSWPLVPRRRGAWPSLSQRNGKSSTPRRRAKGPGIAGMRKEPKGSRASSQHHAPAHWPGGARMVYSSEWTLGKRSRRLPCQTVPNAGGSNPAVRNHRQLPGGYQSDSKTACCPDRSWGSRLLKPDEN